MAKKAETRFIKAFDRETVLAVRDEINRALDKVCMDRGLEIKFGTTRFGPDRFAVKVECTLVGAESPLKKEWERNATILGLNKTWYGKNVSYSGRIFKVEGLRSGRGKIFVIMEHNSKRYRADVMSFKASARLMGDA